MVSNEIWYQFKKFLKLNVMGINQVNHSTHGSHRESWFCESCEVRQVMWLVWVTWLVRVIWLVSHVLLFDVASDSQLLICFIFIISNIKYDLFYLFMPTGQHEIEAAIDSRHPIDGVDNSAWRSVDFYFPFVNASEISAEFYLSSE